jgi:ribosomal protein S18 acetylase RimI-like enzyme
MVISEMTVADCERVQTSWFDTCARATGGEVWDDAALHWAWLPATRSLMLMFPATIPGDAVGRGLSEAYRRKAKIVGAWLGRAVDADPLGAAGFDEGWSPWWMAAAISGTQVPESNRVRLVGSAADAERGEPLVALITERPQTNWLARANVGRRSVGHAWSHLHGDIAGVFDMAVWDKYQRRGIGTELCLAVCGAAAAAGARHAVLNATPDGEQLYRTLGFERLGDGITWWHHLGN